MMCALLNNGIVGLVVSPDEGIHAIERRSLREMLRRWRRCSMGSCLYVAALDDSARPSRPSSNTTTVCHALRLDGRTRCLLCRSARRGGARLLSRGAAAAGAGRWFDILLASFVVAPTSA